MLAEIKAKRPSVIFSQTDATRLEPLALRMEPLDPDAAAFLLNEIERAEIRLDKEMPPNVVRMFSEVTFVEDRQGKSRTVRIVYPPEADISRNRVSVLTPIGAALIGLSVGQSITWTDREGKERCLRVLHVGNDPDTSDPQNPAA